MQKQDEEQIANGYFDPSRLTPSQRKALLNIARTAIERTVNGDPAPIEEESDPALRQKSAVFVTLWRNDGDKYAENEGKRLRGCIGRLQPELPLYLAVGTAAISAATQDPRFLPVRGPELNQLTIEIAVLSPLTEVVTLQDIVIGRDGLVIEAIGRRGLLLPKVASRYGWDSEEFLRNVCLKAGVSEATWPQNGRLYRFETVDFSE